MFLTIQGLAVILSDYFVSYPVTTDLAASVKKRCGYSVPLRWCGQSSRDLTVCELTGRNWGPNPQYFALGNRFHSSETYRRKSVTMVPEMKKMKEKISLTRLITGISAQV